MYCIVSKCARNKRIIPKNSMILIGYYSKFTFQKRSTCLNEVHFYYISTIYIKLCFNCIAYYLPDINVNTVETARNV